ncbi:unnamed protein product [Dovyalis caffra]|uniref:Uncharacterized protein n=1 Tax=Dovyalis caffra TaxID=77055 RepID=A0AAV1S0Q7_9ROSI|nr:unnamed protein product [Dovyalis caffra]
MRARLVLVGCGSHTSIVVLQGAFASALNEHQDFGGSIVDVVDFDTHGIEDANP